jgi:hypothetical protein
MNERERMLAEGPRVAPEPPTADGFAPIDDASPRPSPSPSPSPSSSRNRSWHIPLSLRRLIPLAVFAVVLLSNSGAGKYAISAIAAIAVGAALIRVVRKATK